MKLHRGSAIILAGDVNSLSVDDIISSTTLIPLLSGPERGPKTLDRIFVSEAVLSGIKVVHSAVKSYHLAVIVHNDRAISDLTKLNTQVSYRKRTPSQHENCLSYLQNNKFSFTQRRYTPG